ncbi:zinc ribbon domain-containing protein [bacterium]|nr:zinc ribbon domain-containing protein [bacterium]MBU1884864.1 zinc ribbon domain-containing protein [bacterium]
MRFFNFKKELLTFKDEPLSPLSILLLVILDIFLLFAILDGIRNEERKSPSPYTYFPQNCSKHFNYPQADYNDFSNLYTYGETAPICRELGTKISLVTNDKQFMDNKEILNKLERQKIQNKNKTQTIQNSYNTRLFEKIADESDGLQIYKAKLAYEALVQEAKDIDDQIAALPSVTTYGGYKEYESFVNYNRQKFLDQYVSYEFWQPFYRFARLLTFVVPLFLIALFFYARTKKEIVRIITAHIMLLLFLPTIWNILYLIYHILPKTLLANIVAFFVSIGLMAVFNYIVIGIVVLAFGASIYYIQKKVAARKVVKNRINIKNIIADSKCSMCYVKVDYTKNHCPNCGFKLHRECPHCHEQTIRGLPFCSECGGAIESV